MSFHSSGESFDLTNAIWDDGEWVSWAEINSHVEEEAAEAGGIIERSSETTRKVSQSKEPVEVEVKRESSSKIWDQLMKLILQAQAALEKGENIGGQIGEIGEMYAEAQFGIKRHRKHAQGSDGKLGNDFVEVKTISPWKKKPAVRVKRAGHWSRLVIVRISARWIFEAKIFDRKQIGRGNGGMHVKVSWKSGKQTVF